MRPSLPSDARPVAAAAPTLGVMGGGQLGRMFVHAAQRWATAPPCSTPDPASPAGPGRAPPHRSADYLDEQGLAQLVRRCAAITTEFENVPAPRCDARRAAGRSRRRPRRWRSARTAPPRRRTSSRCGVRLRAARADRDAEAARARVDADAAARHPEDRAPRLRRQGPGARRRRATSSRRPGTRCSASPCVLEQLLPLAFEISVIVARDADGACVHLPVQQNLHRDGILAVTAVPAPDVSATGCSSARSTRRAHRASDCDYVGVLCVEFFVLEDGSLVANEMAPRPHNSGHYSIDACDVSQFELQVRALAGAAAGRAAPAFAGGDAQPARRPVVRRCRPRAQPPWAERAGAAGRAPAPVRQGRGAARPQDGPPDDHRGERRARARGRAARPPRCSASKRSDRMAILDGDDPPPSSRLPSCSRPASWSRFRPRRSTGSARAPTTTRAVAKIFAAKGRPADHPLIVHVAERRAGAPPSRRACRRWRSA